jgi:hypothetical protein
VDDFFEAHPLILLTVDMIPVKVLVPSAPTSM